MIYLIHYNTFCKCHNVSPPRTTIEKKDALNTELCNVSKCEPNYRGSSRDNEVS
jgi:hypothetical protein